jgi:hypothetical protein
LSLPTTAPGTSQCLQSGPSTASQLVFGACGGGGGDVYLANNQTFTGQNTFTGSGNGSTTYGALFKNATNSTTAFQVQNAAGTSLLAADTTGNGQLTLGNATPINWGTVSGAAYNTTVTGDSPYLYWRLGEASGATAADATGNGRTGTYSGTFSYGATGIPNAGGDTAVSFGYGE